MKKEDKIKEEIETLDFEFEDETLHQTVEMLDFESDIEVSNQIDEMLDFIDVSEPKKNSQNKELDKLLEVSSNKGSIEIEASKEKLDEYKPSLKDFNIKNAKTRKIVRKSMLYVIILMLIGFEFFINKTGDALNSLRVYASDNQPIRIVQNEKYGYIDYLGKKIVNPKYTYGEKFIKGYAIVKNASNLPLIIDKGGKEVVPTGKYFSIYRAETDIIASKVTKKGLKYGILDENLKEKTKFIYDGISYIGEAYTYVDGNIIGLINKDGKKIYDYKLTDKDDKVIDVAISPVNDESFIKYGVVKINSSSQIINLQDGKVVSSPTLNEVVPEENNVFYEVDASGNKRYFYVQDNKVLLESDNYIDLSISSISSGVLKALDASYKYQFISTKTLEQLKKGLNVEDTYEGDNVFMYNTYNYKKNKNTIVMVKNGEVFKELEEGFTIHEGFKNGAAIVKFNDGTYGYLNENGDLINDKHYLEALEFDEFGEAIAKDNNGYGVINKEGKIIIKFENKEIKMAPALVKQKTIADSNIFYAIKKDNKFALYNSKGKKVNKNYYNDVIFNPNYGMVKISTDFNDAIMFSKNKSEVNLTSTNAEYESYDNYIILKNEYYNYDGKLIYVDNNLEEKGDLNG